jgi:hypothetical protein
MKRLVLLIFVACSTRSTTDSDNALPAPAKPARAPALVASHGAAIELVAVSDDGRAAASQDAIGGTRLWPTLDGTREPFVIALARATKLAVARESNGFALAALDEGGGLEILRVAVNGSVIARSRIAPDPVIEAIAIGPRGVVALCADQTIAIYATTGERIARLPADAGERLVSLVARRDRVLVLLARDGVWRGRWLDGTSWGVTTPPLSGAGTSELDTSARRELMLSPNGRRLLIGLDGMSTEIDIETGRATGDNVGTFAVGYPDEYQLVFARDGEMVWRRLETELDDDKGRGLNVLGFEGGVPPVVGDGIVVGAKATSLVLSTRERTQQLGYGIPDVGEMHVSGDRVLVTGDARVAVLDARLKQRTELTLPVDTRTLGEVMPIDDRFVIATHTFRPGTWWAMSVNDLEKLETTQAMPHPLESAGIRYEPSTQLVTISDKAASYIARWSAKQRAFESWFTIAGGVADVHLLDPAHNDGLVAIALRRKADMTTDVLEIGRDQLVVGKSIEPQRRYVVAGTSIDVDARGTVYTYGGGFFAGYRHGTETVRIADGRTSKLAPHPHGTYIALLTEQTIRLYDATGTLRWRIAAPLAQRIAWLGDELLVDYLGGLGKIDVATGALIQRACGWSFGLSALSSNDTPPGDSICDAP